MTSSLFRINN